MRHYCTWFPLDPVCCRKSLNNWITDGRRFGPGRPDQRRSPPSGNWSAGFSFFCTRSGDVTTWTTPRRSCLLRRREGLKVPRKQRPRGRLWLNDGSCVRLRPERPRHVWSYDFVSAQTHDGRSVRLLTLIDEYTRECLAIRVARRINSFGVIETFADAMLRHGIPAHIRSDNVLTWQSRGEARQQISLRR